SLSLSAAPAPSQTIAPHSHGGSQAPWALHEAGWLRLPAGLPPPAPARAQSPGRYPGASAPDPRTVSVSAIRARAAIPARPNKAGPPFPRSPQGAVSPGEPEAPAGFPAAPGPGSSPGSPAERRRRRPDGTG